MRKRTPRTHRDPMEWINRRMPLAADQTRDIGLAYHIASTPCFAEAEPIIKLAQTALVHIRKRAVASGEWRINVAHHFKTAIFAALNAHDLQCAECTKAQIAEALREVHRRVEVGEVFP